MTQAEGVFDIVDCLTLIQFCLGFYVGFWVGSSSQIIPDCLFFLCGEIIVGSFSQLFSNFTKITPAKAKIIWDQSVKVSALVNYLNHGLCLHCTAENPLQLPNIQVRLRHILSAKSAQIFRFLLFMPLLGVRSPWGYSRTTKITLDGILKGKTKIISRIKKFSKPFQ